MGLFDYLKVALGALAMLALCHLYNVVIDNPAVRKAALQGYVLEAEKTAAEAAAAEMTRQRDAATQSLDEYRRRAAAAEQAKDAADAKLQELISQDIGDDGAVWTADDLQWLHDH
ncbi:hypothetical protein U8P71_17350 [Rhizobium ruizarguesonis]|nr:hypothetical protein U8P71_17350 [Rhizobium ruizarguesonis]